MRFSFDWLAPRYFDHFGAGQRAAKITCVHFKEFKSKLFLTNCKNYLMQIGKIFVTNGLYFSIL
jgi:hypothetical protein